MYSYGVDFFNQLSMDILLLLSLEYIYKYMIRKFINYLGKIYSCIQINEINLVSQGFKL